MVANGALGLFLAAIALLLHRHSPDPASRRWLALFLGLVGVNYFADASSELLATALGLPDSASLPVALRLVGLAAAIVDPAPLLLFALAVHGDGHLPRRRLALAAAPSAVVLALLLAVPPGQPYATLWDHRFPHLVQTAGFYLLGWGLLADRYQRETRLIQRDRLGILVVALGVVLVPRAVLTFTDAWDPWPDFEPTLGINRYQALVLLGLMAAVGGGLAFWLRRGAAPSNAAHAAQVAHGLAALWTLVGASWALLLVPALVGVGFSLLYSGRWFLFAAILLMVLRRFDLLGLPDGAARRVRQALVGSVAVLAVMGLAGAIARVPGATPAAALGSAVVILAVAAVSVGALARGLPAPPGELASRRHALYRAHLELGTAEADLARIRAEIGLTPREAKELGALVQLERALPERGASELSVGAVVAGRYDVDRPLGGGAFGRVFLARDRVAGDRVVLKELRPEWRGDPEALDRFRREARTALRVRHPNLVPFLGLEGRGAGGVLVLGYVEGESLRARLGRGPLDPAEAAAVGRDLLAGLSALHAVGIVHRDVKPENVLLRPGGGAVLLDFGAATTPDRGRTRLSGEPRRHPGTPAYMAPEQERGEPLGPAADVHAAGVTLWEALAGALPPEGRLPPAWQEVLFRATAPDPARRYPSAEAFRRALPP